MHTKQIQIIENGFLMFMSIPDPADARFPLIPQFGMLLWSSNCETRTELSHTRPQASNDHNYPTIPA